MSDDQLYGLIVQGGIGAAALALVGKIALKVADRMIAAIDALSKEARDTGKATVDALSSLTERLSRLEGKVEVLSSDWPQEQAAHRERARSPVADELVGASPVTRRR
jgi:TolA-binding protein